MPRKKTFDEYETLRKIGHLFWRKGYTATGVDLIGEHVSLKKPSIYNTYGDKASLFRKVIDWYSDEILESGLSVLKGKEPVADEIAALFENSLIRPPAYMVEYGCLMLNSLVELKTTEPDLFKFTRSRAKRLPNAVESYLLEARETGLLLAGTDTAALSGYITAVLQGIQVQSRSGISKADAKEVISLALIPIKAAERKPKKRTKKKLH